MSYKPDPKLDIVDALECEKLTRASSLMQQVVELGKLVIASQESDQDTSVMDKFHADAEKLHCLLQDLPEVSYVYTGEGVFPVDVSNGHSQLYGRIPVTKGIFCGLMMKDPHDLEIEELDDILADTGLLPDDIADSRLKIPENYFVFSERLRTPPSGLRLFVDFTYHREHDDDNKVGGVDTVRSDALRFQHYVEASTLEPVLIEVETHVDQAKLPEIDEIVESLPLFVSEYENLITSDNFLAKSAQAQQRAIEIFLRKMNKKLSLSIFEAQIDASTVFVPNPTAGIDGFQSINLGALDVNDLRLNGLTIDSRELYGITSGNPLRMRRGERGGLCLVGSVKESSSDDDNLKVVWIPLDPNFECDISLIEPSYRG